MPRGQLTKEEIKYEIMRLKHKLHNEDAVYTSDPKALVNKYLNLILSKIDEYAR